MTYFIALYCFISFSFLIDSFLFNSEINIKNNNKEILNVFGIIFLIVISGTRNVGGTDYFNYLKVFNNSPNLREFVYYFKNIYEVFDIHDHEIGFILINSIAKTIGLSYQDFLFFISCFFYLALYFGLRKYGDNFSAVLLVFLYKLFFYNTFVSVRQSITIALFFLSLHCIFEHKLGKYLLYCIIAFLFHFGSLIMIPCYLLGHINLTKKRFGFLFLIFTPMAFIPGLSKIIIRPLLDIFKLPIFYNISFYDKVYGYFLSSESLSYIHLFEFLFFAYFLYLNFEEISDIHPRAIDMMKLFVCLLPIFTMLRGFAIITREKDYFIISYGFLISYFLQIKNEQYKLITSIFLLVWSCFGFFRFLFLFDGGSLLHYQSLLPLFK